LVVADERDAIQKKTFTKWVNKHLRKVRNGQVLGFLWLVVSSATDIGEAAAAPSPVSALGEIGRRNRRPPEVAELAERDLEPAWTVRRFDKWKVILDRAVVTSPPPSTVVATALV